MDDCELALTANALVVGYGSIGQRHARLLAGLGFHVSVLSRRKIDFAPLYHDLNDALTSERPDYVVVANRTSEHRATLERLAQAGFRGRVLIEKPLADQPFALPRHDFTRAAVAYNLRFHPLVRRLKGLLDDGPQRIATATVHVGSYLPAWRPEDYRRGYSARKDQGGGVLRDLSHELDYAAWLFGPWSRITASGGRVGALEIDSEDAFTLLMETERCPLVSVHMSYLDRAPRREIRVTTLDHTIQVDLVGNTIAVDGRSEAVAVAKDESYLAEHGAMLDGEPDGLCTLEEGLATVRTIEAAERAAASHVWIER